MVSEINKGNNRSFDTHLNQMMHNVPVNQSDVLVDLTNTQSLTEQQQARTKRANILRQKRKSVEPNSPNVQKPFDRTGQSQKLSQRRGHIQATFPSQSM